MIFEEKKITLKDGSTAVLRSPCVEDAEKQLRFITKCCAETDFLTRYPEEWECMTIESEANWIDSNRSSPMALGIDCYIGEEIVGSCDINIGDCIKTSHRASVAISVLKEYWNLGIGTAMFGELMAAAEAMPGIDIVELEFIEGNDRARALYEKHGFRIVGGRPNAFKLKDGRMLKEYFMQKEMRKK